MEPATTAKGRYSQLTSDRSTFLTRAQDCAELTIPSLLPRTQGTGVTLPTPYQGMGAKGVNNLSAKLLQALLPANQSFFRFQVDDNTLDELSGDDAMRSKVLEAMGSMERIVGVQIESTATRAPLFECLKHLIVTGNGLLYLKPDNSLKFYRLDKYVVKRDPAGNLIECVVEEVVHPEALPENIRKIAAASPINGTANRVHLYTWIKRKGDFFEVHQECMDTMIPKSKGKWPVDKAPFMALRWASVDGEDYGRGHVEEYIGDLRSLEGLTAAIVEGSAAAAKVLFLVNPNGVTQESTVSDSPNLAVRSGVATDVSVLKVEKFNDFRVALDTITQITQRLAQAFLIVSSITRDAERVTAEEIRLMAAELESALGGVYTILAQEFQLPYVRRLVFQLQKQGKLPELPPNTVTPVVVTGLDALGRGHDLQNLMQAAQVVKAALGEQAMQRNVIETDFINRVFTALSVDQKGLVKTPDQIAAENQANAKQNMINTLGPEAMKSFAQQQQQGAPVAA
ncbi:portal protein [Bosea sp. RCC_152_1]|uniref:portal protein n=1 Tax=Bosea sp. RCC_152_1 TaxID=3239228 RepID=UPI0035245B70